MTKTKFFIAALIISLTVVVVPFLFAQTSTQTAESPKVLIQELKGDVQIIKAGQTQGQSAAQGDLLSSNDKVQTGKDASAKIVVEGAGEINLSKETTWSYEKYTVEKDKREFSAYLAIGRLKAKVQKLPEGSVFQVKTPTSIAAVRGTFFGLFVYMVEQQFFTLVQVFEDSVAFSNLSSEQSYTVEEGQSATANEAGEVTPPQTSGTETDQALSEGESADQTTSEETSDQTPGGEDSFAPPETIAESKPGQAEFEQETKGSQETPTGSDPGSKESGGGSTPPPTG